MRVKNDLSSENTCACTCNLDQFTKLVWLFYKVQEASPLAKSFQQPLASGRFKWFSARWVEIFTIQQNSGLV